MANLSPTIQRRKIEVLKFQSPRPLKAPKLHHMTHELPTNISYRLYITSPQFSFHLMISHPRLGISTPARTISLHSIASQWLGWFSGDGVWGNVAQWNATICFTKTICQHCSTYYILRYVMCFPVGWCCFRNVWYIQGVGSSKSTGSKLCYPVKCGWICINCHKVHRNKEAVLAQQCIESTGHKMVESPLMCNHCFGLGDDIHKIKASICPKALDFTSSDTTETPTEVPPPVLPMEKKVHAGMVETEASRIKQDMEAVQKEIKRLQILREMQVERERLASLLAKKRQATSHLSEWGKVITIDSTWYANTFFSRTYISPVLIGFPRPRCFGDFTTDWSWVWTLGSKRGPFTQSYVQFYWNTFAFASPFWCIFHLRRRWRNLRQPLLAIDSQSAFTKSKGWRPQH